MFRKTIKTIKYLLILLIVIICLPHSILPRKVSDDDRNYFETCRDENNRETRLAAYRDNDEALKIKLAQLAVINSSRKKYKAGPLKLDILASRVANKMSREAAENNYVGHWNLRGEKPYHRYAFAGGSDHVSENAFGQSSTVSPDTSMANIATLMKTGHTTFMAEKSPNDGHKKNVTAPSHNYVGIGCCISGKEFRYYEEYIDRYFEFSNVPSEVKAGEPFDITVNAGSGRFLYYLVVYREDFPREMTPAGIMKKGSYDDFTSEIYFKMPAWDLDSHRNGTYYTIPLKLSREGLYYINIFFDTKEIRNPVTIDTKGKTSASGIVIAVNK
jgi:uncharacterized protein YkwD